VSIGTGPRYHVDTPDGGQERACAWSSRCCPLA